MAMRVHKAVEPDNLIKVGQQALADLLRNRPADALILPKLDGVYVQFKHTTGGWQAWTRTGNRMPSVETPARLSELMYFADARRVYVGEVWKYGETHAYINGLSRRQGRQPELDVYLHDSFLLNENDVDLTPWDERIAQTQLASQLSTFRSLGDNVISVQELVNQGAIIASTFEALMLHAADVVSSRADAGAALDGLILRDAKAPFIPGDGKTGGLYKVKPRRSLDLRIIAEHVEQRDTKLGGYITVEYRGVPTDVGSGLIVW